MRYTTLLLTLLFALPLASAEDKKSQFIEIEGTYNVKFEKVSNNCSQTGMNLEKAAVEFIRRKGRTLKVAIPMVPIMKGSVSNGGKFRAAAKKGKTGIKGLDGKFSSSGRVTDGLLQMILIAEYFRGNQPLCTQSWNATGRRE